MRAGIFGVAAPGEFPTSWIETPAPGVATGYMQYQEHTRLYYQNGLVRERWGQRYSNGSGPFGSLWGWVDWNIYPNGWRDTHAAGRHWNPDPSYDSYPAFYQTRGFSGQTELNISPFSSGPNDDSWLDDLGIQPPIPGHEDHTGGQEVIIPVGDFEKRTYYKAIWYNAIPEVLLTARLYRSRTFQVIGGIGQYVTDYNIAPSAYSAFPVENPTNADGYVTPFVTLHIQQGDCPYLGPVDPESFSDAIQVPMKAFVGPYVYTNTVLDATKGVDIGFVNGQLGNVGNGDWSDHYCNLDLFGDPDKARQPENRWPSETQVPSIDFLPCVFHFGLVFLDGWKHNVVPVSDAATASIGGVEVTYQLTPGWGWDSSGLYYWSDYFQDTAGQILGPMTSSSPEGGVMQIFPVGGEENLRIWGYRTVSVTGYNGASTFYPPSQNWAFEFIVVFDGDFSVGDIDYGPEFDFSMGSAFLELNLPTGYFFSSNEGDWIPSPSATWDEPMHVRFVHGPDGWAMSMWPDSTTMPDVGNWNDWRQTGFAEPNPYPYFFMSQDAGFPFSPYPAIAMKATIMSYTFWDLTGTSTPLSFSGPGQPTGGYVDESKAPTVGGIGALPATIMGSGNTL